MAVMYLTLELGAGTEIKEAAWKALSLGRMLGVHIKFSFNGVECVVYSNRKDITGLEQAYLDVLGGKSSWKTATNHLSEGI